MPKVAQYKKKIVADFVSLLNEYPIVGVVNMENLPAKQLQKMREQLRGRMNLVMGKWRLIRIALEQVKDKKKGIEGLEPALNIGMPAMLFTKENPFMLSETILKNKTMAPAKPGQVAPKDIVVEAGPTGFGPGPIISDLTSIGLKTKIEAGKIVIQERKVAVKEGERVPAKVADVLAKLGIQPMEVGLDLVAVFDNGTIYNKDILSISKAGYLGRIRRAFSESLAVAVEIMFMTKESVTVLIRKAYFESKAVANSGSYQVDESVPHAKASQAEEPKEEKQEQAHSRKDSNNESQKEEPKTPNEVANVENLYEELKKKGTLRK